MSQSIYLLGAGGHGRVLIDALQNQEISISGILDPHIEVGHRILGIAVLGDERYLKKISKLESHLINGLGANPNINKRKEKFINLTNQGYQFADVIHPTAVIASNTYLAEGCQIMAGAILQTGTTLGKNVVINTRASLDHDCWIGDHCFIAPGVVLCGNINIEHSTFIGAGAIILPNLKIGANAIIGAGSVVTKSVSNQSLAVGSPAIQMTINYQE